MSNFLMEPGIMPFDLRRIALSSSGMVKVPNVVFTAVSGCRPTAPFEELGESADPMCRDFSKVKSLLSALTRPA